MCVCVCNHASLWGYFRFCCILCGILTFVCFLPEPRGDLGSLNAKARGFTEAHAHEIRPEGKNFSDSQLINVRFHQSSETKAISVMNNKNVAALNAVYMHYIFIFISVCCGFCGYSLIRRTCVQLRLHVCVRIL